MASPGVSWHARLRWLERVRDVDVDSFRRDLAAIDEIAPGRVLDCDLVEWVCAAYDMRVESLDEEMLTDGVRAAINAGAVSMKLLGGKIRLNVRDGVICTVTPVSKAEAHGGKPRRIKNRNRRGRQQFGPAGHHNG